MTSDVAFPDRSTGIDEPTQPDHFSLTDKGLPRRREQPPAYRNTLLQMESPVAVAGLVKSRRGSWPASEPTANAQCF